MLSDPQGDTGAGNKTPHCCRRRYSPVGQAAAGIGLAYRSCNMYKGTASQRMQHQCLNQERQHATDRSRAVQSDSSVPSDTSCVYWAAPLTGHMLPYATRYHGGTHLIEHSTFEACLRFFCMLELLKMWQAC